MQRLISLFSHRWRVLAPDLLPVREEEAGERGDVVSSPFIYAEGWE